jgi:hypothetical protein
MERLSTISINGFRLSLALLLLNSTLTFQNRWPTAGVRWVLELSLDLIALLLALVVAWRGPPGRWGRGLLLGGVILLTLGRYMDVTAPALMGRSVHLYWDSQHLPQVATMLIDSVAGWQLTLGGLALLVAGGALVVMLRWALNTVIVALGRPIERCVLGVLAAVLLTLYGAGRLSMRLPTEHGFALPVTPVFIEQLRLTLDATVFRNQGWIAAQPPLPALNLNGPKPGDVFVIFFESYGALVFDAPRFAAPLADEFATLEQSLESAGWRVASARVESSTFGGGSWLAHASFLSGLRIADQGDYRDLLVSNRQTVVHRFADAGYRTIAVMPGLRYAWPEGRFYGFTEIYSAERLDYRGPAYGWWVIPDQYSLYRIHRTELDPVHRPPLFLFFPTINSHAPFAPLPPYQLDWSDFDAPARESAVSGSVELSERLDGAALAPAYLQSIRYNLAVLGGYLRQYAPANALFLVLGDHQPPAVVGGREIPWQVPVHVFSRDPAVLEPFIAVGFRPGMVPGPTALSGIEQMGSLLLELGHEASPPQPGDIHSEGQRQ